MKFVLYLFLFSLIYTPIYAQVQTIELSHYVFPEFTPGIVLSKKGNENKALLNYNSLSEEMVFDIRGKKLGMIKEQIGLTDTVFIKDRKFVVLNNQFLELLYDSGSQLFAEYKCKVLPPGKPAAYGGTSQTSATTSLKSFNREGMLYNLKLPEGYETKPYTYYWLRKNGKLKRFISIRELQKLYADKKNLIKAYINTYEVKYSDQESLVRLITYFDNKLIK